MFQRNQIILKHLQLHPNCIRINTTDSLILRISHDNDSCFSEITNVRKFFFLVYQTDEQIGPLTEGDTYSFKQFTIPGNYTFICTNYPKISAQIEVYELEKSGTRIRHLEQVKEEEKEDQGKYEQQDELEKSQEVGDGDTITDFNLVLDQEYESVNHKYLRYFKEQFKLWRNFFQNQQQFKPIPFQSNSIRPNSATSNYEIPNRTEQKQTLSNHLYSHQQILQRRQEELGTETRCMKKTNSEYLHNIEHSEQKELIKTQTETDTFMDWAMVWALQNEVQQICIPLKDDNHLIGQYLTFLRNKFQIVNFLHNI